MLEVLGLILNTQLYSQHLVRGGRRARSHPQLHSEFEASLEYMMSPANQSINCSLNYCPGPSFLFLCSYFSCCCGKYLREET